jgi:rhodanese-related sulfurtransferase
MGELESFRDKKLILVCKFGQTAGAAGKQLAAAGFDVAKLKGGMAEWQASSLPLVKKG